LDTVTYGDDIVGVNSGYWGIPIPSFDGVLYINNKILSEAQQPHPHELDEQGLWNWKNFQAIAEAVTQQISEDRSIIAMQLSDAANIAAIYSNGGRFSYIDSDGKYKVMFNDNKVYEAIEWMKELADKKIVQTTTAKNFTNDKNIAFCVMPVWWGYRFNDVENWPINAFEPGGFSWAQFPVGPNGDSHDAKAGGAVLQGRFITLTAEGVHDSKILGQIIDDIFEPLDGENTESWKNDFKHSYFFNESEFIKNKTDYSFDKYEGMLENANRDGIMLMEDMRGTITNAISAAVKGLKTPTEALEALVNQAQATLDKNTAISN
jgi:ABC-type glycerol-3-phosphate transport system substrate-binding protein